MEQMPPPPPPLHPSNPSIAKRVFGYDQGQDSRWKTLKSTEYGACIGLSLWWIIAKAKKWKFVPWLTTTSSPAVYQVASIMQKQDEVEKDGKDVATNRQTFTQWIARLMAKEAGVEDYELILLSEPQEPLADVLKNIHRLSPCLVLFDFQSQKASHACAFYVNDPSYVFFDPNFGEDFYNNRSNFEDWMQAGPSASLRFYLSGDFLQFLFASMLIIPFDKLSEDTQEWLKTTYSQDAWERIPGK
jgi:hypothetical protein